jgi:DNA topoisomerase-1
VTDSPVEVHEGRYGPYVKHEKTNATIPKEVDKDAITLDEALVLIADREVSAPAKKGKAAPKKAAAKKPAAKKAPAKKPAAKKAPAKKTTAKKAAPAATPSRLRNAS